MMIGYYLAACYLVAFVVLVTYHDKMRNAVIKRIEEDDNPELVGVGLVFDKVWLILMMTLFILAPLAPPLLILGVCARIYNAIGWAYHKWKVRRVFNRLKGSLKMYKESPESTRLHQTLEQLELALKDKGHM